MMRPEYFAVVSEGKTATIKTLLPIRESKQQENYHVKKLFDCTTERKEHETFNDTEIPSQCMEKYIIN